MHQYTLCTGVLQTMLLAVICACSIGAFGYRARPMSHANSAVPRSTIGRPDKEITFIRHAESLGNLVGKNPWQYVSEAGGSLLSAWKDGRLTHEGKQYTQERVMTEFSDSLLERILSAELIYVSPLIRAMETLMIVLSSAVRRKGMNFRLFDNMKFVVTADLREKMGSQSDKPGASGVDVTEALWQVAQEQASLHVHGVNSRAQYEKLARNLIESYNKELNRTDSFKEDPDDADKVLKSIERFRAGLDGITEKHVLIVGHSGWSRWNFAAGLQGRCGEPRSGSRWADIAFGGRQVGELKNLGVVTAKFSRRQFRGVQVFDAEEPCPKKTKFGAFSSIEEAKEAALIPQDTIVHHMHVSKKMDHFGFKGRWLTFSASGGFSFLAWSNTMGEPRKYINLVSAAQAGVKYACDKENKAVLLDVTDARIVWNEYRNSYTWTNPFQIRARGENESTDFNKLCFLLSVHIKFGTDAEFLRTMFREIGWDNGMKDLNLDTKMRELESQWKSKHPSVPIIPEISYGEELEQLRCDTGLCMDEDTDDDYAMMKARRVM